LQAGAKTWFVDSGKEGIVEMTVDVAVVVPVWAVIRVTVLGGSWIVVSPSAPWRTVEVEMLEEVDVVVAVVNGARTVKSPDGEPDEIRLVAVRVKVDVLVNVVMHCDIVGVGGKFVGAPEDETRHVHADMTKSELNAESPIVSVERKR